MDYNRSLYFSHDRGVMRFSLQRKIKRSIDPLFKTGEMQN